MKMVEIKMHFLHIYIIIYFKMKKCVLIYIYHLSVGEDIILMHDVMSGNPEHTQVHSDQ